MMMANGSTTRHGGRDVNRRVQVAFVEPFFAGSHAAFAEALFSGVDVDWRRLTLPGRHWKWRMRGSAAFFASSPELDGADVVLASSYVPLAELVGLRPALAQVPRVLYFHENQLTYPNQTDAPRDHHFGFTQLVSCLAATECWFNSAYNLRSFLDAGRALLARMPDAVPPGFVERIEARASVMPVPLELPSAPVAPPEPGPPLVLWNHRWEHDKDPWTFFAGLEAVAARGVDFALAVAGPRHGRWPDVFDEAAERFADRLVHFGPADRATYESLLHRADLAVSTAQHEFFGIAMLEATHFGACPLVPDDLAYAELFGPEFRYARDGFVDALAARLTQPRPLRADRRSITAPFGAPLIARYQEALERLAACHVPNR
jgi:glycosyltransferase involved in cell wall biosynthesis